MKVRVEQWQEELLMEPQSLVVTGIAESFLAPHLHIAFQVRQLVPEELQSTIVLPITKHIAHWVYSTCFLKS